MAQFENSACLGRPIEEVFDFFVHPANLPVVSPPELHLEVAEAPEKLELGARLVVKGRRWGIPHRVVSEVVAFEPNVGFVDEQVEGPFRHWVHTHRFESLPDSTRVLDHIDFAPPGGFMGLIVTTSFIEKDLAWMIDYRNQKLHEVFGPCEARR
jgi:ligand-binding SRPBCC domain-containing protein